MSKPIVPIYFNCEAPLARTFEDVKDERNINKREALEESVELWTLLGRDPVVLQMWKAARKQLEALKQRDMEVAEMLSTGSQGG